MHLNLVILIKKHIYVMHTAFLTYILIISDPQSMKFDKIYFVTWQIYQWLDEFEIIPHSKVVISW